MANNKRMKAARVLLGMTQRQLAQLIGTREIEISRIETGRLAPANELKEKIAKALDRPVFEFFDN